MKRIDTPRGPIFVRPGASDVAVVYVHGYYDTAESAIRKHKIPEQVKSPATLIIPEAPKGNSQGVHFPSLDELVLAAGVPGAKVMALGHSGAYRTLRPWLSSSRLKHVVLLDALYAGSKEFEGWARQPGHQIDIVGQDTASASRSLASKLGVPYYPAKSHMGIVKDGVFIPQFIASSKLLAGRISLGVVAGIAVGGYLLYRVLS
jgi:hypothetical protein